LNSTNKQHIEREEREKLFHLMASSAREHERDGGDESLDLRVGDEAAQREIARELVVLERRAQQMPIHHQHNQLEAHRRNLRQKHRFLQKPLGRIRAPNKLEPHLLWTKKK
jgi:hypothetical protein